jgi:hypothetical protein
VIIDTRGIRPQTITRAQGKFVLFILNRLTVKDETFTMVLPGQSATATAAATAASAVAPAVVTSAGRDCNYIPLDLAPGTYQLMLTNHTTLSVKLTITK